MALVHLPEIPHERTVRVVILSDAKNEADDQYAIAHAILSPSIDVRGLVAGHFVKPGSMERSFEEERLLVKLLHAEGTIPVFHGAQGPLDQLPKNCEPSEGARFVVREAESSDERPLYVLALGALTEMAEALRMEPRIAHKLTLVWVGGGAYPKGGREANLRHDIRAAQEVFASGVTLVQITVQAYQRMIVPIMQLGTRVAPAGELGKYLYRELVEFSQENMANKLWIMPEAWCLGDNSAVGVLLYPQVERSIVRPRPTIADDGSYGDPLMDAAPVRVYEDINSRFILEDLFQKIEWFAQHPEAKIHTAVSA